ncbi:MAG: hypothetical protein WC718_12345 [Phycisphaerales bacterium]|jgi:hypothetical protein
MSTQQLYAALSARIGNTQTTSGPVSSRCPTCGHAIPTSDVNMAEGVAMCRGCNVLVRLADILKAGDDQALRDAAKGEPPDGAFASDDGAEMVVSASCRSVGGALGLLAVSLFWNGIVSVFVFFAIAGTVQQVFGNVPSWLSMPGNQPPMTLGMVVFLWLFLTPFILIGGAMMAGFFMCLWGRVEVRLRGDEGTIFSGIGPVGRTKRFNAGGVKHVAIENKQWRDSDGDRHSKTQIVLEAEEPLRFGSMLPDNRRRFMAGMLLTVLVPDKA